MVFQDYGSIEICTKQMAETHRYPMFKQLDVRLDSSFLLKLSHAQKLQIIKPFAHI